MIVKFHARGRGGGSGPVDYLLGKDRNREQAFVLQGKPEEVRELIDATPFAKKYTSGVLSFAESELPPGAREKIMASFERILMPGLEKNQYSILWVEHRDKGRVELNFLIPNMELQSGKRLQPYYDRADRPRVDAWQRLVNHHYGLHDPNAPENRRTLVTPNNLPGTKKEAAEAITRGLEAICRTGEIKTRQDVIQALTAAGFEVVRTTRSSISIADPDGGRNLRLKGAIYEQSFENGHGLRAAIERAGERYRENAERRVQQAREICRRGVEIKRAENQRRYPGSCGFGHGITGETPERCERRDDVAKGERVKTGNAYMVDHAVSDIPDVRREWRSTLVHGESDRREPGENPAAERHTETTGRENVGRTFSPGAGREISGTARGDESGYGVEGGKAKRREAGEGVISHDRTGKAVIERIRAVTAGLCTAAERMGARLRGIAGDVFSYAAEQRNTEKTDHAIESAGAGLERANRTIEPVVQCEQAFRNEMIHQEKQRQLQLEKELELTRSRTRERSYPGPSL